MNRLTFDQVKERAKAQGMRPDFEEGGYLGSTVQMQWRCLNNPEHVLLTQLRALRNGCFQCKKEAGSPKLLTFEQVTQRAKALGFRPGFKRQDYGGRFMMLPWICLHDASHTVVTTLSNLVRGCAACRQWERVNAKAKEHGFRPGFKASEYQSVRRPMQWICLQDARHLVVRPLDHLNKGCTLCRREARHRAAKLRA